MLTKTAQTRIIINADYEAAAKNILAEIINSISIETQSSTELKRFEDDNHFEFSFAANISAKDVIELELNAFKLCTDIANGPWLFIKIPDKENGFEFEAIFNHEAFIHHSKEYKNKLKWAHIEIIQ